jgi:transcriptional regulator with XRE-family HTH domain
MSQAELARRLRMSGTRVGQIEHAEVRGSIPLSTLERAASALNCRLCYAFVPVEPLEQTVWQQALGKAAWMRAAHAPNDPERHSEHPPTPDELDAQIEALAHHLVDRQGLWTGPTRPPPPEHP